MVPLPPFADHRHWFEETGLPPLQQEPDFCSLYSVGAALEHAFGQRQVPSALSTAFLAWARDHVGGERGGSNFSYIAAGVSRFGVCRRDLMPEVGEPSQAALDDAASRRDVEARWIKFWDVETGFSKEELDACRTSLASGRLVALGARWPRNLAFSEGAVMAIPEPQDVFDGHCVTLVGYRDEAAMPGGGAFHFRNSWGPGWGDGGYGWMPYAYLERYGNDAFTVAVGLENQVHNAPSGQGTVWRFEELPVQSAVGAATRVCAPGSLDDRRWSAGRHLLVTCEVGGTLTFALPTVEPGNYRLTLYGSVAPGFARVLVSLDGRPLGEVEGYNPEIKPTGAVDLGKAALNGEHTLSLTAVGQYAHAPACEGFGLDCLVLTRVGEFSSREPAGVTGI